MKKIYYLIAMAFAVLTFTSCEDVPAPFGQPVNPNAGTEEAEPSGNGTAASPYNVAGILAYVNSLGADVTSDKDVYITGYVVGVTEAFGTQYGSATFTIGDSETSKSIFTFYRGLYFGGQKYSDASATNVKEGDKVVICGKVVLYKGNTPETSQGNAYIVSINGVGGSTQPADDKPGEAKGKGTEAEPFNVAAAIAKCQEVGQTASTESYYIQGIVAADYTVDSYKNATFDLIDAEGSSAKFTAYRVKGTGGTDLTEGYKIPKGATVIVYGPVVNFKGNTPETSTGAYIVSVNGQPTDGNGGGETPSGDGNDGTLAKPFTPAEANAYIATLTADTNSDKDIYVKGKVASIKEAYGATYGNGTFYVSQDGTTSGEQFYVYRALYLENKKFEDGNTGIKEGDEVIICGQVVNYRGTTSETVQGKAYLYSLNGKTTESGGNSGGGDTGGTGTLANPLTASQVYDIVAAMAGGQTSSETYYVKGKICSVKFTFSAQYGTATFNISDDGKTGNKEFTAYSCYYFGNNPWVEGNKQVAVGDEVIVCGKVVNYNGNTPEFASKQNYIVSLNGKTE